MLCSSLYLSLYLGQIHPTGFLDPMDLPSEFNFLYMYISIYLYIYMYILCVSRSLYLSIYIYLYILYVSLSLHLRLTGFLDPMDLPSEFDFRYMYLCICVVCLSLPPRASGMGGGARDACSLDSRVRGQASWGATLALPLSPFAEQLGFNPSPAAAVGGGCRYARGGRFALYLHLHIYILCVSLSLSLHQVQIHLTGFLDPMDLPSENKN